MLDPLTRKVQRKRKNGLSLRQISQETGVSKSTVQRLVSGPRFRDSLLKYQEAITPKARLFFPILHYFLTGKPFNHHRPVPTNSLTNMHSISLTFFNPLSFPIKPVA